MRGEGLDDEQVMHAMSIDDAYHVERVFASGAGGTTELVTLDGSGPFVRKRIPSKLARRGVWGSIAECACPRLPRVEASYEMPDEFVVVCDYVPGENLEQIVSARGRLPEDEAREIVAQLCEAAAALHAHGIVHRDISPRNVVVAADGAHLIDLGIARFRSAGATHDTTQLGTPGFASPEQHGFAQTDARSDVYSLGRVLGYLLTGVLPDVPEAAEYERTLRDPGVVQPGARAIVERASAMEPSARYQSAEELAEALTGEKNVVPTPPATSPVDEPPTFAPVPGRRNWLKVLLAMMALAAFAVAVVLILVNEGVLGGEKDGGFAAGTGTPVANEPVADSGTPAEGDGSASGAAPVGEMPELEIVESGWSVDEQGYVHYGLGIRSSGEVQIELPGVTITGRDAEGKVLFSSEQYLSLAPAGAVAYFAGQAGNGGEPPAEVEFTPIPLQDYNVGTVAQSCSFAVSGTSVQTGRYGMTSFVGGVTTVTDDGSDVGSQVALALILRNGAGEIIYGDMGFIRRPEIGASTSFEISAYDVPEYATYEVYASAW